MHHNPLDQETKETIDRHKQILMSANDDFVAFIQHMENQRKKEIQQNIFEEKLNEFARVDEKDEEHENL